MGALGKFLLVGLGAASALVGMNLSGLLAPRRRRRRARAGAEPRLLPAKTKAPARLPKAAKSPWVTVRDEYGTMRAKIIEHNGPPGEVRVRDEKGNRWYVKRSAITPKSALR